MEPFLRNNNVVLTERITDKGCYKRFDVIIFKNNGFLSDKYIKRIIGLPGETIQIENNHIYINGKVLRENYGVGVTDSSEMEEKSITLGSKEYFVLGDNRENSLDSRFNKISFIQEKKIIGRVWCKIWPIMS